MQDAWFLQKRLGKGVRSAVCSTLALLLTAVPSGCSWTSPANDKKNWLMDGTLALSRPVPQISTTPLAPTTKTLASNNLPEPLPLMDGENGPALIVSRKTKTITALQPGQAPLVLHTEGTQYLVEGSFSVTLKEENPLWYAPRDYFTKRSLDVPEEGSRERFRRAALGTRSLFLNNQTPIHSGPVWMQEIGGLRVTPQEMTQLFSMVSIGTRVEIR